MANSSITSAYEALPKIAKVIIQILTFYLFGCVYRVFKFVESKKTSVLIYGLLSLIPVIDLVVGVFDIYSEVTENKITYFVD